jgi:hypothetical protein
LLGVSNVWRRAKQNNLYAGGGPHKIFFRLKCGHYNQGNWELNEVAQQAWQGKNIDIFFKGAKEIKAGIYLVPLELNI